MAKSQTPKRGGKSSPSTGNSNSQSGQEPEDEDVVIQLLKDAGTPVTRKNYLEVAYLGRPPKTLSAEQEAELPDFLQKWD